SWKTQLKRKHSSYVIDDELLQPSGDEALDAKSGTKNDFSDNSHNYIPCRLRYQQTKVELYTKFFSTDHNSGREASLLNRRISIRITHLLMPYIRVTDPK